MKSKFKGDVEDSDEKVRAENLEASTKVLKRELRDIKDRIRSFGSHVDHVVFNKERKDAPLWCPDSEAA